MARYNQKTKGMVEKVVNHQGGLGYQFDPKMELIGILMTGFNNTYYEKLNDREIRFADLIRKIAKKDLDFVAKALVYTRSVVGQRSVTHFGSVILTPMLSGTNIGGRFFSKRDRKDNRGGIVYRLDDMLEIFAAYLALNPDSPMPNAMRRGFKSALENADTYEIAKYQGKGKAVSLVDIVNLVRPKPRKNMEEVFKSLMTGGLKQFNTVEDKNTKSGQEVAEMVKAGEVSKKEGEKMLKEAKESNYRDLITSGKIGYLALLRNLRNILKNTGDHGLIDAACVLLTDEKFIRKSLVFPHQIDLALEVILIETSNSPVRNKIVKALGEAYELAIPNLTELFTHGRTAVIFDSSGSMSTSIKLVDGKAGRESAIAKAALIAATLAKGIGADVYHFANYCEAISFNPLDSVNTIKNKFLAQQTKVGYGTNFDSIFDKIGNKYDRIFVISDMQGNNYLERGKYSNMYIYSVDIAGYGTTMFKPNSKIYQLFGYTAETYELVKKAEIDPKAILKEIDKIVI